MTAPPEPPRHSLFSRDTLAGLHAATEEAERTHGGATLAACLRVAQAVAASDAGRTDEARSMLDEALASTSDARLLFLGFQFHFRLKEYDQAEHLVRRRLDSVGPDTADAARAWSNLGLIHHFRGDAAGAEAMIRRALDIDRRLGNDEGIARDLGNLALVPEARGDLDTAERLYRESLAIAESIGAAPIIATKLTNLGEIALARGNRDEARSLWARAHVIFQTLGEEKYREQCQRLIEALDKPAPA